MGDPRKHRKKFQKPKHRWLRSRIEKEKILTDQYGLKNKKEIYRADSQVRRFGAQAKKIIRERGTEQAIKEEKDLLARLVKLGLLKKTSKIEEVLGLTIESLLDRRLQTVVFRQGLAIGVSQARQFIVHGHVFVDGKKVDVPSYLVSEGEVVSYNPKSGLNDEMHPERAKRLAKDKVEKLKEESKVAEVELPTEVKPETKEKFMESMKVKEEPKASA